jgi:hypothetical protein
MDISPAYWPPSSPALASRDSWRGWLADKQRSTARVLRLHARDSVCSTYYKNQFLQTVISAKYCSCHWLRTISSSFLSCGLRPFHSSSAYSRRWTGFNPRLVHVADKVALGLIHSDCSGFPCQFTHCWCGGVIAPWVPRSKFHKKYCLSRCVCVTVCTQPRNIHAYSYFSSVCANS